MGSQSERRKRFREAHPVCYFCAIAPTASEDHVPSRECFKDRVSPEGYVFPACRRCNNSAGKLEQVVALYLMLANHDDEEPSVGQLARLAKGVKNNNPEFMPRVELSANAARRHFRAKGIRLAPGVTYGEVPIAELPAGNRAAFELFARRLVCALYYKEVKRPLPLDHFIATGWLPFADPGSVDFTAKVRELLPQVRLTNRSNTDIGNQFFYLWGAHSEGALFAMAAQFSKSFFFFGAAVAPAFYDGSPGWKPHSEDVAALTELIG